MRPVRPPTFNLWVSVSLCSTGGVDGSRVTFEPQWGQSLDSVIGQCPPCDNRLLTGDHLRPYFLSRPTHAGYCPPTITNIYPLSLSIKHLISHLMLKSSHSMFAHSSNKWDNLDSFYRTIATSTDWDLLTWAVQATTSKHTSCCWMNHADH